jgi:hypothetical protein
MRECEGLDLRGAMLDGESDGYHTTQCHRQMHAISDRAEESLERLARGSERSSCASGHSDWGHDQSRPRPESNLRARVRHQPRPRISDVLARPVAEEALCVFPLDPVFIPMGDPLFWWADSGSWQSHRLAGGNTAFHSSRSASVVQATDKVRITKSRPRMAVDDWRQFRINTLDAMLSTNIPVTYVRLADMRGICIIVALILSSACVESSDEVARVRSPNGLTDAVLVESNGGATTSFGYQIVLTQAGRSTHWGTEIAGLYGAIRSDSAYGVNLRWRSNDSLRIEYLGVQAVNKFIPSVRINRQSVFVSLDSGIPDPRAPSGGMLWNLQRSHK